MSIRLTRSNTGVGGDTRRRMRGRHRVSYVVLAPRWGQYCSRRIKDGLKECLNKRDRVDGRRCAQTGDSSPCERDDTGVSASGERLVHQDEDGEDGSVLSFALVRGVDETSRKDQVVVEEERTSNDDGENMNTCGTTVDRIVSTIGQQQQYKVVLATACAFVIGNMDKINISLAIVPMAREFGWSQTVIGLVQSGFFYGYLLAQLPGGYAASRLGGAAVLPAGVGLWSLSTACIPFVGSTVPGLFVARALVGLGEGLAPSAATDVIAKTMKPSERSSATSFVFGGLHVGSLVGLVTAPALINTWGWESVFYIFGIGGLAWNVWWSSMMAEIKEKDAALFEALSRQIEEQHSSDDDTMMPSDGSTLHNDSNVPWRAFLRSKPVLALAFVHFCNNWFHYVMLAWLPTYFIDTMDVSLSTAAKISLLPPVAALLVSGIAGPSADALIGRGVATGLVRKGAQSAAFLGPAACLILASMLEGNQMASMTLITISLGLASFSLAGLYCNHADLSPRYAPVLIGATNTAGAIPGIVGVLVTGVIYDHTDSWTLALFVPTIALFISGTIVFIMYGTAKPQNFDKKALNKKFEWERVVESKEFMFESLFGNNGKYKDD